ncbi:Cleavage and polyadenylation specificity factor subunit 3 [Nowakowskiella sp. JEL0407]|nr:Cleavage and polyadenylation specificity factor subunit 3 [Nowakowskiella sp. JEL0407]
MLITPFKGRVFMTHPTKAIFRWLLSDFVKVSNIGTDDALYDEDDLTNCYSKIEPVDYHQEIEIDGIRFTPYYAGHVLGAAMFLIEIAGVTVLYTGDYSREEDRHLRAAEKPPGMVPDVLICESTYGVQSHEPRLDREARFTRWVHDIVARGGRCLIPVFALGWTQELLLILDEYWENNPALQNVPIYYASSLAKKCMAIYQTYTNMMNEKIRRQKNPFQFRHISNLRRMGQFEDVGPCVMMASPGMLQSGLSRELLEMWCVDKRNGLIVPGYVVEGTLGKDILSEPDEIPTMAGGKLPRRLEIHYISFSAHVDYRQNSQFIEEVGSPHLILVHGESNEMNRLRSAMESRYAERDEPLDIYTPRNTVPVELYFRGEKLAKTIGTLAESQPESDALLSGVLLGSNNQYQIMAPEDVPEFTELQVMQVMQKMSIPCRVPFSLVKWHLEQMYGSVEIMSKRMIRVFDVVVVTFNGDQVNLEWEGNSMNDMIADTVIAIIVQAESSPASVKATKSKNCHHGHSHTAEKDQKEDDRSSENVMEKNADKVKEEKTDDLKEDEVEDDEDDEEDEDQEDEEKDMSKDILQKSVHFMEQHFGEGNVSFKEDKIHIIMDGEEAVVDVDKQWTTQGTQSTRADRDAADSQHDDCGNVCVTNIRMETLQEIFPDLPKQELEEILSEKKGNVEDCVACILSIQSRKRLSGAFSSIQSTNKKIKPSPQIHQPIIVVDHLTLSSHLPCELFLSFVPNSVADCLLTSLLTLSEEWEKSRHVLLNKAVISNHTCKSYTLDDEGVSLYNGENYTSPLFSDPDMMIVKHAVDQRVNDRLKFFKSKKFWDLTENDFGDWKSNFVLANRYNNQDETVGSHSDDFTVLGTRPIIASYTLGAGRKFRIKRLPTPSNPISQTYDVILPHNSLLIMFPPLQELYRHELPKQKLIDVKRHTISGLARINLTFRMSKKEFVQKNPKCYCGNNTDLKITMNIKSQSYGRYFYSCGGAGEENKVSNEEKTDQPTRKKLARGEKCTFFQWFE